MKTQGTLKSQTMLKKNNKVGGITLPDYKTYRARVIKHMWYGIKIDTDRWNTTEFRNKPSEGLPWWRSG